MIGGGGGKAKACRLTYANVYAITTYVLALYELWELMWGVPFNKICHHSEA